MGLYDDLNKAGLVSIGLKPEWVDQATYTGAPSGATAGVYLQDSPRTQVKVRARELVHQREARVTVTVADLLTCTYTVTIDGTAVVYNTAVELPASAAALVIGLAAAIAADGVAGLVVTAVADPDDATKVLLKGIAEADWSLDATAVGGTGAVTSEAAAIGFDVRLYNTEGGLVKDGSTTDGPNDWVKPADADWASLDYTGFLERFDTAGLDRMYVELHSIAKHANDGATVVMTIAAVRVGPAVLEATT